MTFCISLWDHEANDFSDELAREHLEGPNEGLGPRALREALRTLYGNCWDRVSIFVAREDE